MSDENKTDMPPAYVKPNGKPLAFPEVAACRECGSSKLHWHASHAEGRHVVLSHADLCPTGRHIDVFEVGSQRLAVWNAPAKPKEVQ